MHKLSQIESIGVKFTELLLGIGIEDQEQLLAACKQRGGLQKIAKETGINLKLLAQWTTHADLARINGIGNEYAELLEYSGLNSVKTLAQYSPGKLQTLLQENNANSNLVKQLPSTNQIQDWIAQAQKLKPQIEW